MTSLNPIHAASVRDVEESDNASLGLVKGEEEEPKPPTDNSFAVTVFLILNTMIGSGILNQPQVFMASGIFGALIIFVLGSTFTWLGLVVLVDAGAAVKIYHYSELAKFVMGRTGEWWADFFIVLYSFGGLMSYIDIVGGTSSDLFQSWGCNANFCQVLSTTSFFIFIFDLPLCLVRFYGHYGVISVISMISIFSVLCLVVIGGPVVSQYSGPITLANPLGTMAKMGSVLFALGCAPATFHAYNGMKETSPTNWTRVSTHAVVIGALLCCVMGIAGYLVFGSATHGEIISNFPPIVSGPFKVLLVVHLILYIPIDFVIMRFSFIRLLGHTHGELPFFQHAVVTILMLAAPLILVLIMRASGFTEGAAFGFILDFTGGVAASFTCFIFPAVIYLKSVPFATAKYYWMSCAMFLFGIFAVITVPIMNILILNGNVGNSSGQ